MANRPITKRRVKNAMEKAVKVKGPDYVYEKHSDGECNYLEYDGERPVAPSCLVGHALVYLGIPKSEIAKWEGSNVNGLNLLLDEYGVPYAVRLALQAAQKEQDSGATWGDALTAFNNWLDGRED